MAWIPPGPERLSSSPCATPPSPSFASWCMRSTCSMTKTSWLRLHSPSTAWRQVCRWVTCCNVCCDKTSLCLHPCVGHQGIVQYLWRTATTKIWSWLLYWSTWTSSEGGWDTAMSSDLWYNTVMSKWAGLAAHPHWSLVSVAFAFYPVIPKYWPQIHVLNCSWTFFVRKCATKHFLASNQPHSVNIPTAQCGN